MDGQNIFVASYDGALYSLNSETGETHWMIEKGAYVPVTLAGERIYYSTVEGQILVLDKASGKTLREIAVRSGIPTQVTLYKNFLIYGESEGNLVVASAETGAPIAQFAPGSGLVARPSVMDETGETFFISNGANLFAMKMRYTRSGDRLPWQE